MSHPLMELIEEIFGGTVVQLGIHKVRFRDEIYYLKGFRGVSYCMLTERQLLVEDEDHWHINQHDIIEDSRQVPIGTFSEIVFVETYQEEIKPT